MAGVEDLDEAMAIARKHDALSVQLPSGMAFTLAPKPLDFRALDFAGEGPDIPDDPNDPALDVPTEHTSPIPNEHAARTPAATKRKPQPKLTADGERVIDPANPSNPDNPVDFGEDFPDLPRVPGSHPI